MLNVYCKLSILHAKSFKSHKSLRSDFRSFLLTWKKENETKRNNVSCPVTHKKVVKGVSKPRQLTIDTQSSIVLYSASFPDTSLIKQQSWSSTKIMKCTPWRDLIHIFFKDWCPSRQRTRWPQKLPSYTASSIIWHNHFYSPERECFIQLFLSNN